MSEYINPLDFKKVLLEVFLGSPELFMFAFTILISFVSAKFGFSNKVYIIILVISSLLFGVYLGNAIYVLVIFLVGYISFKSIARIVA